MPGPLEGVRVVELGVWVAGPAAAGVLSDWGADVVKIEPPGLGDPARSFSSMLGGDLQATSQPGAGSMFRLTTETGPLDGVRMIENLVAPPEQSGIVQRPALGALAPT